MSKLTAALQHSLTLESLNSVASKLPYLEKPGHYTKVYESLINTAATIKKDVHSLSAIAHMAYGWMPTIVETSFSDHDMDIWEVAESGEISNNFFSRLKSCINNSVVGASKFLHFINPQAYAIWDSRVYAAVTNKKPYNHNVNKVTNCVQYMLALREFVKQHEVAPLRKMLIDKKYLLFEVSDTRVVESLLFYKGTINNISS